MHLSAHSTVDTAERTNGHGVVVTRGQTLTITGDDGATLHASGVSRHFTVAEGAKLRLKSVVLTGGRALLSGGGSVLLLPGATLEAESVTFRGNRAVFGSGGAIACRGASLSLRGCRFEGNTASLRGGAISVISAAAAATAASHADAQMPDATRSTISVDGVSWEGNIAGHGANDVQLSGSDEDLLMVGGLAGAVSERSLAVTQVEGAQVEGAQVERTAGEGARRGVSVAMYTALESSVEALELQASPPPLATTPQRHPSLPPLATIAAAPRHLTPQCRPSPPHRLTSPHPSPPPLATAPLSAAPRRPPSLTLLSLSWRRAP